MADSRDTTTPHIVFLPSPGMGHITPLFQLAKRLVLHHGIHVTFLVFTTGATSAQDNLVNSCPQNLHLVNIPPADVSSLMITDDTPIVTQISIMVRESLKPLKSILLGLDPIKALIIDIFTTEAIDVCKELSIPVYSFFTASPALLAFSLYLPALDHEVEGEFIDLPEPIKVPGCKPLHLDDLLDQVRNRKIDEYKWYLYHVSRIPLTSGVFINTWEALHPVSIKAMREQSFFRNIPTPPIYSIGPLIKDDESLTEKDDKIIAWLDKQPPNSVLFVALGSGGTLSSEQLAELALGLESSRQRFILVARKPVDANASAAFFGAGNDENTPAEYLPDGFVERTRGVGLVVPTWAPQVAILRHVATGCFLSHCGWNSTLESLVQGVPMIAWPLYAEQRMNAALLAEEVGVAVRVAVPVSGEGVVGRSEVARAVRVVMEEEVGECMRVRGRELKESAREALECGGESREAIWKVVEGWKSR